MTSPDYLGQAGNEAKHPWMANAACVTVGPQPFYPEGTPEQHAVMALTALATCDLCPVRHDCLEHALATDERYGIWGGTTPNDRARIQGQRRQA